MVMMRLVLALVLSLTAAAGAVGPRYVREVEAWQRERAQRLTADGGWLTVAGLFWLQPGANRFGADAAGAIVLPAHSSPPQAGSFVLEGGRVSVEVRPGAYRLHQTFQVAASHPKGLLGKAASAEFAPDPALDPLWISYWEPFKGASKKDFGFQVTLRVASEPELNGGERKKSGDNNKGTDLPEPEPVKDGKLPENSRKKENR